MGWSLDPDTGTPVDYMIPPILSRHQMGDPQQPAPGVISGIERQRAAAAPDGRCRSVGGITLGSGAETTLHWLYDATGTEDDPLTSTIKLKGTDSNNRLVYAQSQATIDIANLDISISAVIEDLDTDTVLRGGELKYRITVTNLSATEVCNVWSTSSAAIRTRDSRCR